MDDILRIPYLNEAEVKDIIKKVYDSKATKVTGKELQAVNIYRIDSPGRNQQPSSANLSHSQSAATMFPNIKKKSTVGEVNNSDFSYSNSDEDENQENKSRQ
jgi:hypothetical protein